MEFVTVTNGGYFAAFLAGIHFLRSAIQFHRKAGERDQVSVHQIVRTLKKCVDDLEISFSGIPEKVDTHDTTLRGHAESIRLLGQKLYGLPEAIDLHASDIRSLKDQVRSIDYRTDQSAKRLDDDVMDVRREVSGLGGRLRGVEKQLASSPDTGKL